MGLLEDFDALTVMDVDAYLSMGQEERLSLAPRPSGG